MRFTYSSERAKDWKAALERALRDPEGTISMREVQTVYRKGGYARTQERTVDRFSNRDLSDAEAKKRLEPYLDECPEPTWVELNWVRGLQPVTPALLRSLRRPIEPALGSGEQGIVNSAEAIEAALLEPRP